MAAKEQLAGIVSSDRIFDDPEILDAYSHDLSFTQPIKPQLLVKPHNADEVRAIVNWANQTKTPLVPVSSGQPRFHGDTIPGVNGVVIVDLSEMKNIMRIDRRNRIAMIEPGVTYPQLQPELAKEGMRLTMPLVPRSNKSIMTSLLEREPTLIPRQQWSILDPLRCTEIVWGDGNILRTGDSANWPSMKKAFENKQAAAGAGGPGQTDFYRFVTAAQGSMGIVTWISVKCEVLPDPHKLYFVTADDLNTLIDFTYQVLRVRFGDELLILNNTELSYILGESPDQIKTLMGKIPPWVALVGIAGRSILPQERVAFQEKDIADMAQSSGLKLAMELPGAKNGEVLETILNVSREPYWKLIYKSGYQDIFFLTTLNRTPEFIKTMNSIAEASGYPVGDIGIYIQPLHQGASCHCEFTLPFDRNNPEEEAAKMQQMFTKASEKLIKAGAFFSRPYGIWAKMAYKRDPATTRVLKKLKGIFDPNNIMNPGKLCF